MCPPLIRQDLRVVESVSSGVPDGRTPPPSGLELLSILSRPKSSQVRGCRIRVRVVAIIGCVHQAALHSPRHGTASPPAVCHALTRVTSPRTAAGSPPLPTADRPPRRQPDALPIRQGPRAPPHHPGSRAASLALDSPLAPGTRALMRPNPCAPRPAPPLDLGHPTPARAPRPAPPPPL
eukprot:3169759-Prymnesium_polylepis.1